MGLDVGDLTKANFDRLGMTRTSLVWHNSPENNVADGWNDQGQPQAHDKRSKVRVAGSMNTTISDLSKFAAALARGDGLSAASRAEMTKPVLHITTAHQFPLFLPDLPVSEHRKDLYAGLGIVGFDGPQGHGFYKGSHDGQTANTIVCIEAGQRYVVILRMMFAPRRVSAIWSGSSSATPAFPVTGNMATKLESRKFSESSSIGRASRPCQTALRPHVRQYLESKRR